MSKTNEEKLAAARAAASAASIPGPQASQQGKVWIPGSTYVDPKTGKRVTAAGRTVRVQYDTNDRQVNTILSSDPKTSGIPDMRDPNIRLAVKSWMVEAGYLDKNKFNSRWWGKDDYEAFKTLLAKANEVGTTWISRLQSDVEQKIASASGSGSGTPKTQVYTTYSISSPDAAKAAVRTTFRAILGRDPSDQDLAQFTKAYRNAERANPTVTRTTQTAGGATTTTTGGMSIAAGEEVVQQKIMADKQLETESVNKVINSYGDVISKLAGFRG